MKPAIIALLIFLLSGCASMLLTKGASSLIGKARNTTQGKGLLDQAGSILDTARGCNYRYEEVCDWKEVPTVGTIEKIFHGKTRVKHVCNMEEVKHCPGDHSGKKRDQ